MPVEEKSPSSTCTALALSNRIVLSGGAHTTVLRRNGATGYPLQACAI